MKLHLPKLLRNAVLACMAAIASVTTTVGTAAFTGGVVAVSIAQQAQAGWSADSSTNGYIYFYDASTTSESQVDELVLPTAENGVEVTWAEQYATAADKYTNLFMCPGYDDGEGNQPAGYAGQTSTIGKVVAGENVSLTVAENPWQGWKYYSSLIIEELEFDGGTGAGGFGLTDAESIVTINRVSGSLSSVTNAGSLTIGTAEGTTRISGTLSNTGTLKVNGTIIIDSLQGFSSRGAWSDEVNSQGFRTAGDYILATGNTTFTVTQAEVMGVMTTLTTNDAGETLFEGTADTSLYYIINADVTAGVTGTAADTNYDVASGRTLTIGAGQQAGTVTLSQGATLNIAPGEEKALSEIVASLSAPEGSTVKVSGSGTKLSVSSTETRLNAANIIVDGATLKLAKTDSATSGTIYLAGDMTLQNNARLEISGGADSFNWGDANKIEILNSELALSNHRISLQSVDEIILTNGKITGTGDGQGALDFIENGAVVVSNGTSEISAPIKLRGNASNVTTMQVESGTLTIGEVTTTGSGVLKKTGAGTMKLTGTTLNSGLVHAEGAVQVAGTVDLQGTSSFDAGTTLSVVSGGTLNMTGTATMGGTTTVSSGGTLNMGGTLTWSGALTVENGGVLILDSMQTVEGSLSLADDGALRIGNIAGSGEDEATGGPAAGQNGWDYKTVSFLKAAASAQISGLDSVLDAGGSEVTVSTETVDGFTIYNAMSGYNYYVQDTETSAEYSTATGLVSANSIIMSDGTTLVVKDNLDTSKVVVAEGGAVNYEVDGGELTISQSDVISNIASLSLTNAAKAVVTAGNAKLGTAENPLEVSLSGASTLAFRNGNNGAFIHADITVAGEGSLAGSYQYSYADVRGTVTGDGTLTLTNEPGKTNGWFLSSTISGNLALNVTGGSVTVRGDNSYTGGTIVYAGSVTADHEHAFGQGGVEFKSGATLTVNSNLHIQGDLTLTQAEITLKTTTIDGNLTLSHGGSMLKLAEGASADEMTVVTLKGGTNALRKVDLSDSPNKKLVLEGGTTTLGGNDFRDNALWLGTAGNNNATLYMEGSATLVLPAYKSESITSENVTIVANGASATLTNTGNNNTQYRVNDSNIKLSNVSISVDTVANGRTLSNLLVNSSVTNTGEGLLTVNNNGNTLTAVTAEDGSISVVNATADAAVSIGAVTAADAMSVSTTIAHTQVSALTLGAGSAFNVSGALTLADNAALEFATLGTTAPVTMNGALTLGTGMTLTAEGITTPGDYVLMSGVTSELASTAASNYFASINGSSMLDEYELKVEGNNLILVHTAPFVPETDWTWEGTTGGGGVWGSNADNWASDTGATSSSTDVSFTAEGAGEVQIDGTVTAKDIYVTEGEYTFTQKEGTTGGITANSMTIRGDNTSVTIENANTIGTTNLKGGTLVLSGTTATTGGNVVLGGGLLKYDGSTLDISSNVSLADGYNAPVKIEVTENTNVTWTKANKNNANGGVDAILTNGIVKTGAGTMNVQWQYGTSTVSGAIDVQSGRLNYISNVTTGAQLTLASSIYVAENAAFQYTTDAFSSTAAVWATLSGAMTGKGTIEIGTTEGTRSYGQYKLTGDNSGFEGTLKFSARGEDSTSATNAVVVGAANSLGGEKTTLELNGRQLWLGSVDNATFTLKEVKVNAGTTNYIKGDNGETYNINALLTGSGQLISYDETTMVNQLSGNISGFTGTITAGNKNTWLLGGDDVSSAGGAIQATLNGKAGTIKTQYSNATTISGAVGTAAADTLTLEQTGTGTLTVSGVIGGAANVKQSGTGTLVLTAENTTTGTMTIDSDKKVQLGTADTAGKWVGTTLAGAGTLEIVNGSLGNAMTRADDVTASIVVNAAAGKDISLGGTAAGLLSSVTLGAGSELTGVTGELAVGSAPVQSRAATTGGLESLNLTLTTANIGAGIAGTAKISGANITINDASKVTLALSTDGVIDLLQQHKTAQTDSYLTLTTGTLTCSNEQLQKLGIAGTLMSYGIRLDGVSGGSIVASGKVDDIYFVTGDNTTFPHTVSDYNTLGMYKGTVIKENQSLDIKMAGDTAAATKVTLNNLLGGTGSSLVVTNTGNTGVVTVELSNQSVADTGVDNPTTIGTTTTMDGSITGNAGTELVKTGDGTLVVNGKVQAAELEIAAGELQLNNASNTVTTLNGTGGSLQLGSGSKLTVSGGELAGVTLKGADTATSTPELVVKGDLALRGTSALNGVALEVASGKTLSLAGTTNDVVALTGSGTVAGVSGTVLSLDNAADTTYSGALTGAGTLKVENGGKTFTLKNASTSDWSITNAGKMVVDMTGSDTTPGSFGAQALTLAGGSSTEFLVNTDNSDGLSLKSLIVEQGAALTITSTGIDSVVMDSDGMLVLGTVDSLTLGDVNQVVTLQGAAFSRVEGTATLIKDGNELKLQVAVSKDNKYLATAETTNGKAGAELLWNADSAAVAASPVLTELDTLLQDSVAQGESQDELLASVAGASTAVLGMAVSGDVERQLQAIRNRTTTMGVDQGVVNPEMPYFNAWINAEADNTELGNNGTEGGYKLNSWGGTVGFDVDFTPTLTAGLALTAMYGDLHVSGADAADGDLDTYYVSAFARYNASAWTHTFVATAGLADLSLNRTVMGEEVKGETDGLSFGLMYEVGRVFALNEDATACLQPILNVSWRHTELDSYSEKGSALALDVDKQTYDTVSFGLGARLQAVVGESMYNRTSIFECRLLAKLDTGDTQGTSKVGLAGATAEVESAERGAFGLEAGAGLTIPLGEESSSIFADASIELRSDYTNVNGTVGYRINF